MSDRKQDEADVVALFQQGAKALQDGDFHALAALCDPASVQAFARNLLRQYEPSPWTREQLVELYRRHSPDIPEAVLEHNASETVRSADPLLRLSRDFPGARSLDELRVLRPAELFARWGYENSPAGQLARAAAAGTVAADHVARIEADQCSLYALKVLGVVFDGPDIAHAIYRRAEVATPDDAGADAASPADTSPADASPDELAMDRLEALAHVESLLCRRVPGGEWRIVARHGALGLGAWFFVASTEAEPGEPG